MSLGGSALVWTATTAAMMLPSVSPVASHYARSVGAARASGLVGGYLLVWSVFAVLASVVDSAGVALGAATVLALAGLYQLTPLKNHCLRHCRSPLGFLLRFAGCEGRLRDLRAGVVHGGYCLGCCWALMATLLIAGMTNVAWMLALTALILLEKTSRFGRQLGVLAGLVLVAVAVVAVAA